MEAWAARLGVSSEDWWAAVAIGRAAKSTNCALQQAAPEPGPASAPAAAAPAKLLPSRIRIAIYMPTVFRGFSIDRAERMENLPCKTMILDLKLAVYFAIRGMPASVKAAAAAPAGAALPGGGFGARIGQNRSE